MVKALEMKAEAREGQGTAGARNIRRTGRIPGIIYGGGDLPVQIAMDIREIEKLMHKPGFFSQIFDLDVNGTKSHVLPWDVQVHPVSDRPLHVDFLRVTDKTKINVEVHLKFTGQENCKALSQGGLLNIVCHEIEVNCEAGNIPQELIVDVSQYEIGDAIHLDAVQFPSGVKTTIKDKVFTVATITEAKMAEEVESTAPVDAAAVPTQAELDKKAKEEAEAAEKADGKK